MNNPQCLECESTLTLTKLENKWRCKNCNEIYEDSEINW